jgi:hypothetical protein
VFFNRERQISFNRTYIDKQILWSKPWTDGAFGAGFCKVDIGPRLQGDLRDYLEFVTLVVESCGISKEEGTAWVEAFQRITKRHGDNVVPLPQEYRSMYRTIYSRSKYRLQSIKRKTRIGYPLDMFPRNNQQFMKTVTLVFVDLIDVIAEILTDSAIVGKFVQLHCNFYALT